MPVRKEGDKQVWIPSGGWDGHVDKMIREAQERGDFDNLPGAGQPLDLGPDTPFGAEWQAAFRIARNAGAAPLWVELDKEIGGDTAALDAILVETAANLSSGAERLQAQLSRRPAPRQTAPKMSSGPRASRWLAGLLGLPGRPAPAPVEPWPRSLGELEAERLRARALYLSKAAELDRKIVEYNAQRPRTLAWLEKPRLLPAVAAQRFDTACPPLT